MKRKQLAKRVAIAMLSATTVMTSVPATAVFAAETSVEASDAASTSANTTVTVVAESNGDDDGADAIKTKLNNAKVEPDKSGDTYVATDLAEKLTTALGNGYTVDNVTITDATKGNYSFSVVDIAKDATYTVTVTDNTAAATLPTAVQQELNYYFAQKSFDAYDGKALSAAYIASTANSEMTKDDTAKKTYANYNGNGDEQAYTIKGGSKTIAATGEIDLTVSWKVDEKDVTAPYTANVTIVNHDGTQDSALSAAIQKVAGTTYAYPGADNSTKLQKKIAADLKAAGALNVTEKDINIAKDGKTTYPSAADVAKRDRSIVITVGDDATKVFTVNLTKSSQQKLDETLASVKTALGASTTTDDKTEDAFDKKNTPVVLKSGDAAKELKTKTETTATTISLNTQKIGATTAASEDDAVKAVQDAIDAQLAKDKVASNGVTVKASAVDTTLNKDLKAVPATSADTSEGTYYVLVTASTDDDFTGWGDKELKTDTPTNYVVIVKTRKLTETKATGITLADQTVAYKNDTNFAGKEDGEKDSMEIDLTPVLTPAGANSAITWTVTGKDAKGKVITNDENSKFKYDATTYGTKANKLLVKQAGTYTVTAAHGDDVKATATVTVTSSFKDVSTGAYYADAVQQAYAAGIAQGVGDNKFDPNGDVTRGQFVTFLYRYAVASNPSVAIADADVKETFSDVPTTSYYAKAVQWASENKIAFGTGDGKFDPNAKVTRGQAVTFIYRAKSNPDTGAAGSEKSNTTQFTDLKDGAYYLAPVTWGVNNDVVSGLSNTKFGPEDTASRAQAITFIARAYNGEKKADGSDAIFHGIKSANND